MSDERVPVEYSSESLSRQERRAWKELFARLSRSRLKAIGQELLLASDTQSFDREVEIAETHCNADLVAQVIRMQGKNRRLQQIYCSAERCEQCPHGPYWYVFQRKQNKVTVLYAGQPAYDEATLDWMRKSVEAAPAPVAYEIKF